MTSPTTYAAGIATALMLSLAASASGQAKSAPRQAKSAATTPPNGMISRMILDELEQTIEEGFDKWQGTPGLAVALVGQRGAIWARGYGFADLDSKRRVTADTPFMLASVSKTLIAAAILSEHERGRINLDQDINDLLPFRVKNPHAGSEAIKVWHLATHTSGIYDHPDHYEPGNYHFDGDTNADLGAWLRSYLEADGEKYNAKGNFLKHPPGTKHEYSNIGATLAAYITECTSGVPYKQLLRDRFFHPLGMQNTAFDIAHFEPDTLAVPYFWDEDQEILQRHPHYSGATYPDGWLRSSVNDLSKYLSMMINRGRAGQQQLLTPGSIDTIEKEWFGDAGEDESTQALFWQLKFDGRALVHSGFDYGATTFIFYFPGKKMGGIVLENSDGRGTGAIRNISLQALTDAISELSKLEAVK